MSLPMSLPARAAAQPGLGRSALVAGVVAFLWLTAIAWCRPLMLPDEGRYVGVAWEMLRSGDWLTPTLNGLPYFHKPPLFYWITAISLSVFGPHEWAARAAPLLGAWTGAMAVFLFVRRWWGEGVARTALFVLSCQPLYFVAAQFANLDMLVAGCITASTCLLAHCALTIERGQVAQKWLAAAYGFLGLGVLAKGLIGIVIPAAIIGVWLLLRRQWRAIAGLYWLPGLLLGLAISMPWFVAMQSRFPSFLDYFFVVQHFKRFATSGFNNVQPVWFYPAVLLGTALPWLASLRPQLDTQRLLDTERGPVRLLLLVWLVFVLLFFSIPKSKLLGYILPAVVPLAILMADGIETLRVARGARAERGWWLSAGVSVLAGVGLVVGLAVHPLKSTKELAAVLHEQRSEGEPVFMIDDYAFDLPWYARLKEPVRVVDDWDSPDLALRDNWRKELADAGLFAPERAKAVLIRPEQLAGALRESKVNWLLGADNAVTRFPVLMGAQIVASGRGLTLWRLSAFNAEGR